MALPDRLIYAFDPLCGWCYGFAPVLDAVHDAHPDLPIDVCMGGLVTGERVGPYSAMRDYIKGASARMAKVTGRRLEPAFFNRLLADDSVVSSSVPPCIVTAHAREAAPDTVALLSFMRELQNAHFQRGADYNDPQTYRDVLDAAGIAMDVPALDSTANVEAIAQEFANTRALGINSYPSVLAQGPLNQLRPLAVEYDPDTFLARLSESPADTLRYAMPADGI
ncbi:MAG: DsbA family protein [Pseudomonadota bacterium]